MVQILVDLAAQCGIIHMVHLHSAQRQQLVEAGMVIMGHCTHDSRFQHVALPPGWRTDSTGGQIVIYDQYDHAHSRFYEEGEVINLTAPS